MSRQLNWQDENRFSIREVEFFAAPFAGKSPSASWFTLLKNRAMIDGYAALLERLNPSVIVELGVFDGGSAALIELLAQPERLLCFDIEPTELSRLATLIESRGAQERVRVHCGVSQTDRDAIESALESAGVGRCGVDLVIDDASHDLAMSRESFNHLFPKLRPGGVYLLEDWGWGHFAFAREREGPSLAKLALEIMMSIPFSDGLVDHISVDKYWVTVVRGESPPIQHPFDIRDHLSPRAQQLLANSDQDHRLLDLEASTE